MVNKILIINVGISGSGKTTWTTKYIKEHPSYLRINRDDLRLTLKGTLDDYYNQKNIADVEGVINELEMQLFVNLIENGFNIIIDNTNLTPIYIEKWISFVKYWNNKNAEDKGEIEIKFNIFEEKNPDVLKERVSLRDLPDNPKALDYIDNQIVKFYNIKYYLIDNYKNQII